MRSGEAPLPELAELRTRLAGGAKSAGRPRLTGALATGSNGVAICVVATELLGVPALTAGPFSGALGVAVAAAVTVSGAVGCDVAGISGVFTAF